MSDEPEDRAVTDRDTLREALTHIRDDDAPVSSWDGWREVQRLRDIAAAALAASPPFAERLRDAEEVLCEFAEDVVRQYGYWIAGDLGGFGAGGLSTMEDAFAILGWNDPHPYPEMRCDEPGCMEQATCGWPTRPGGTGPNGGYRHTCGSHMRAARLSERTKP